MFDFNFLLNNGLLISLIIVFRIVLLNIPLKVLQIFGKINRQR